MHPTRPALGFSLSGVECCRHAPSPRLAGQAPRRPRCLAVFMKRTTIGRGRPSSHHRAVTSSRVYPVAADPVPRRGHHQPVDTRSRYSGHSAPPDGARSTTGPRVGGLVRDYGRIASPRSPTGPRRPGHSLVTWKHSLGAGEGIRTPDPLITNQLLYRTELRQPDQTKILAQLVPQGNRPVDSKTFSRFRTKATGATQPQGKEAGPRSWALGTPRSDDGGSGQSPW